MHEQTGQEDDLVRQVRSRFNLSIQDVEARQTPVYGLESPLDGFVSSLSLRRGKIWSVTISYRVPSPAQPDGIASISTMPSRSRDRRRDEGVTAEASASGPSEPFDLSTSITVDGTQRRVDWMPLATGRTTTLRVGPVTISVALTGTTDVDISLVQLEMHQLLAAFRSRDAILSAFEDWYRTRVQGGIDGHDLPP